MNYGYCAPTHVVHGLRCYKHSRSHPEALDYEMLCGITYVSIEHWRRPEEGLALTCVQCVVAAVSVSFTQTVKQS